jgi:hypothetical protein
MYELCNIMGNVSSHSGATQDQVLLEDDAVSFAQ